MSELEKDPEFVARRVEAELGRVKQASKHRVAALPVLHDLKKFGFSVDSLDELRRMGKPYKMAIPILLRWLPEISDLGVKESIVRALSVPWPKGVAAQPLINEFRGVPDHWTSIKWVIGSGLEVVADDSVFSEIVELVRDKRHGKAREMLAASLGKMKKRAAVDVLIELLADDEVVGHAIIALRKLKADKARPAIERLQDHPEAWVRQEAKKALAKLDSA